MFLLEKKLKDYILFIVLMLVSIPPYGVYLIIRYRIFSGRTKKIVMIVSIIWSLGWIGLFSYVNNLSSGTDTTVTTNLASPKTTEQIVADSLNSTVSRTDDNGHYLKTVRSVSLAANDTHLLIELNSDDSWTQKGIIEGMQEDVIQVMKALKGHIPQGVTIIYFDFYDYYLQDGKSYEGQVLELTINQDDFNDVWDVILPKDIPSLVGYYQLKSGIQLL